MLLAGRYNSKLTADEGIVYRLVVPWATSPSLKRPCVPPETGVRAP